MDFVSKLVIAVPLGVGLIGGLMLQVPGVLDLFDIASGICSLGLIVVLTCDW